MDNISLSFRIAVNSDKETIVDVLKREYLELDNMVSKSKKFELRNNHVIIQVNKDFDSDLIGDGDSEDDFLYFESIIDVYPSDDNITLEEQIIFARGIVNILNHEKIQAIIVSEFEHLL